MALFRARIAVSGLSASEAQDGLPDLLAELRQRYWIVCPDAVWEHPRLIVTVHYECGSIDACTRLASDEVWDCVIACVPAGAAVGALLFVLLFCCPFGLPWIFAWSGAGAGAATCALGSTIFRPLPSPNHGAAANGLWLGRRFCLPRPSWARGRR